VLARIAAVLFLLASAAFCWADSQSFGGQWKGLDNSDAAILIGDNEAQDLLNVDITDNGSGIRKRSGYSQFKTIGTSTWGVRGGYYYTDTSGNRNVIHANNRSVFKSQNSGAYSAFITTDTAGTYYDFTDSQGYLYRATSDKDLFARYDGTTLTYYPSNPQGDQVEAMPDRLVVSGVTAYPNRVYFSGAADFTNFTTGLNDTDPFYEQFGLPGQKVNAIKYAMGRVFAWTGTTLSYWTGSTQFDGTIQDVTTNIGTNQPGSILYENGTIFWQGNDKHFYSYDGNNIDKISAPISGSVSGFVGGEGNVSIQTTQADFALGTTSASLTTSESPGFISFKSNGILIDDFTDNNITVNPVWVSSVSAGSIFTAGAGYAYMNNTTSFVATGYTTATLTLPFEVSMDLNVEQYSTSRNFQIRVCTGPVTMFDTSAEGCYSVYIQNDGVIRFYKNNTPVGSFMSTSANPIDATKRNFIFANNSSGRMSIIRDGAILATADATDTTYTTFGYVGLYGSIVGNTMRQSFYIDNVYSKPLSGTFVSSPFSIGTGITSWGQFSDNNTTTGNAALTYAIYGDSNTVINTETPSTFISSQTITSGSIPTISTAAYIVVKATFTRTASTETASIDSLSMAWNEGTITHTYGSIDKNHRLLWSLAENNSTANNATYIYDQRFNTWLKYSFALDAPTQIGDTTYFGGPSTGVVYYFPSGTSDNGSDITAYWKSKDFIGGDPFVEKDYKNYSLIAKTQVGSTLSFDYALNGSASATSRTISLTSSGGLPYIRNNGIFGTGTIGSFVNFKVGNTGSDNPFEVYAVKYDYMPRAWRVLP